MRFLSSVLAASLVAVAAGLTISRGVEAEAPVDIKEACRGLTIWHPDGFYRSGTTTVTCGNALAGTRAPKTYYSFQKEIPEESDVWRDLGTCDPDVMDDQVVLGKRSVLLEARDDDDDCRGYIEWDAGALVRSGSTRHYKGALWQADKWNTGEEPGVSSHWTVVHTCGSAWTKTKRSCDGFPTFVKGALNRPGNTIQHDNKLYQAKHWTKTSSPDDTEAWSLLGDC